MIIFPSWLIAMISSNTVACHCSIGIIIHKPFIADIFVFDCRVIRIIVWIIWIGVGQWLGQHIVIYTTLLAWRIIIIVGTFIGTVVKSIYQCMYLLDVGCWCCMTEDGCKCIQYEVGERVHLSTIYLICVVLAICNNIWYICTVLFGNVDEHSILEEDDTVLVGMNI